MKKKFLLFALLSFTVWQQVFAYDFEVDGICYTVSSFENNTVAVDGLNNSMSGIIDIPSSITYSGKFFSVTGIKSLSSIKIESVNIPKTIKEIGANAFSDSSIKSIFIPDNVTEIGFGAFSGCKELEKVRISNNVVELRNTFVECIKLKDIDWNPNTNEGQLSGGVFFYCKSLKTFKIPSGVSPSGKGNNIHNFEGCESLDSIIVEDGDNTPIRFAGGEFHESPIKYLYIGRPVSSSGVVKHFSSLESIEIGNNITELPDWFLYDDWGIDDPSKLKRLVIGASLKSVRDFSRNEKLEYIKIKNKVPPTASGFSNYNYINTILYVPKGTKPVYESSDIWKNFWNIQEYDVDGGEVEVKKCANPTINYSNGKLSFICETEDAICQASITDADIKSYTGNEIQLDITYVINVYATKAGYENSETVTATLCWIEQQPTMEGITNNISQLPARAVLIQSQGGMLTVQGIDDGSNIAVYTISSQMVGSTKAKGNHASFATNIKKGEVAIIKIGEKSVKVVMQ